MRRTGVDSAEARPVAGPGYHMNRRQYGTGSCAFEMNDGLPCAEPFEKRQKKQIFCDRHCTAMRHLYPKAELRERKPR